MRFHRQQLMFYQCRVGLQLALLSLATLSTQAQDVIKTTTTINEKFPASTIAPIAVNLDSKLQAVSDIFNDFPASVGPSAAPAIKAANTSDASILKHKLLLPGDDLLPPPVLPSVIIPVPTTVKPDAKLANISNSGGKQEDKLDQYFAPVCKALDKLHQKQLFKIQTQLKQFVEKTNGKLSVCFLTHFKIDPNLDLVDKHQLDVICSARKLAPDAIGSFESFKNCAAKNWDKEFEQQLDRIHAARVNCSKNHKHSKAANSTASLLHDDISETDDEIAIIGDVVSNLLDGNNKDFNLTSRSNIKVIDVSEHNKAATTLAPLIASKLVVKGVPTTLLPLASSVKPATTVVAANSINHKHVGNITVANKTSIGAGDNKSNKLLNDPNTVLVFVDNSSPAGKVSTTTKKPFAGVKVEQKHNVTLLGSGAVVESNSTTTTIGTTASPGIKALELKKHTGTASILLKSNDNKTLVASSSTAKPAISLGTTVKPTGKVEDIIKHQEKEKHALDLKLNEERENLLKQLKKKQDELDTKYAIKQLQLQRAVSVGHQPHDLKLHALEHQRQMAIDPVGHTIKHQQYEFEKQQRALKAAGSRVVSHIN